MRIAIIGAGIAGNSAAWALSANHDVTVYERERRPGGHSHTVTVDYDGTSIPVDIGFIIYNELNYPEFSALLRLLDVATAPTSMTFAVSTGSLEWRGGGSTWLQTLTGLFVQPKNLFSLSFLRMLRDVVRFNGRCVDDLAAGRLRDISIGDYLARERFSPRFLTDYLAPMGAAIWSAPAARIASFPAEHFVRFFHDHGLVQFERPVWRTVRGGSRHYVEKLTAPFRDRLRLGAPARSIERMAAGVAITDGHGASAIYDEVVVACHSDQALALLSDADQRERDILGAIGYSSNAVYLHRDPMLMPRRRQAWACWNYLDWQREGPATNDLAVTYWMNPLQGLDNDCPIFVSLNPPVRPRPELTFGQYVTEHPQYDAATFEAQRRLAEIQGQRHTWFCGAWTRYGFHEDGLRAGLDVAEALGSPAPWRKAARDIQE
jgi:predicted NAD/FAD-binding protein